MKKDILYRCGALLAGICFLFTACSGSDTEGTRAVISDESANLSQSMSGTTLSDATDRTDGSSFVSADGSSLSASTEGSVSAVTMGNDATDGGSSRTTTNGGGSTTTESQGHIAAGSTAERILNSASLNPMRTNCTLLDQQVDTIFAQILKSGLSTYDKVKACFDYLTKNGIYSYNLQVNDPAKEILYDSPLDANIVALAYGMLSTNRGVCDHYSAAFVVMTRAIGLESYLVTGKVRSKGGGYTGHTWVNIRINGTYYVFDPQVQQNNAGTPYYFFCKTDAQMGDMYQYSDRSEMINQFHNFQYYPKVSATITVHSGGKTYQASLSQSSSADGGKVFPEGISVSGDGSFSIDVAPAGGTGQYLCQIGYFWNPGYYAEKVINGPESFTVQMEPGTNTIQVAVQNNASDLPVQDAVIFEFSVTYTGE